MVGVADFSGVPKGKDWAPGSPRCSPQTSGWPPSACELICPMGLAALILGLVLDGHGRGEGVAELWALGHAGREPSVEQNQGGVMSAPGGQGRS